MEDRREQIEALEILAEYNDRVVKNIKILIKELSGERLDDTDKFLNSILEAINWEIQVVNATLDLLNEGSVRVRKDVFNACVTVLGAAVQTKQDEQLAEAFSALLPELVGLGAAIREVLAG